MCQLTNSGDFQQSVNSQQQQFGTEALFTSAPHLIFIFLNQLLEPSVPPLMASGRRIWHNQGGFSPPLSLSLNQSLPFSHCVQWSHIISLYTHTHTQFTVAKVGSQTHKAVTVMCEWSCPLSYMSVFFCPSAHSLSALSVHTPLNTYS